VPGITKFAPKLQKCRCYRSYDGLWSDERDGRARMPDGRPALAGICRRELTALTAHLGTGRRQIQFAIREQRLTRGEDWPGLEAGASSRWCHLHSKCTSF